MGPDESVTDWVRHLRAGDDASAGRLWERYFGHMVRLACARLPRHAKRTFDEEDVALSAFHSFCAGVEAGRFPHLSARDELWRLLVLLTARKAQAYARHAGRAKRGGGRVVGEGDGPPLDAILGAAPTPSFVVEMAEEVCRRLDALPDDESRKVALLKMEGHTADEIAAGLGLSVRSVERRLAAIRQAWA